MKKSIDFKEQVLLMLMAGSIASFAFLLDKKDTKTPSFEALTPHYGVLNFVGTTKHRGAETTIKITKDHGIASFSLVKSSAGRLRNHLNKPVTIYSGSCNDKKYCGFAYHVILEDGTVFRDHHRHYNRMKSNDETIQTLFPVSRFFVVLFVSLFILKKVRSIKLNRHQ